jgi:hypothetical protein
VKRIVLLVTVVAVIAAMMAASAWSVSAQGTAICAPWSKEWNVSQGWWYFDWYRWCYDPSTSDPSVAGSWVREWGTSEWAGRVNLCPETGRCTITTG